MSGEEIIRAFVHALLDQTPPQRERKPREESRPAPQQLGFDFGQITQLIDARLQKLLYDGTPAPSADDLTRQWLSTEEMQRRQQRTPGTYRPDGDYANGDIGPTTPWVAPPVR